MPVKKSKAKVQKVKKETVAKVKSAKTAKTAKIEKVKTVKVKKEKIVRTEKVHVLERKIVCDVPREVIVFYNDFLWASTDFKSLTMFFNAYFYFYINTPPAISASDILVYESLPGKTRNNFSFYLKRDSYIKLELMAKANLRTVKHQSLHFIYSVYKYLTFDPFKNKTFNLEK